jgi:serine/threonine protein kinase
MEGKQSEYDFLNLSKNYTLKNNITREEEIQFSDKINKVNSHGWKQERNIIITDKAIYNLKKLSLKRRIDFKTIIGITLSKVSDEFVIHCNDIDYDYHYISSRKKIIVEIVAKNYQLVVEEELKLFELPVKNLGTFVTSKKEKEKQKNTTRMPKNNQISVNDYLFGNQSKTDVKNIQTNKGPKKKSTFHNVHVEYTDFEIIKIIGRGAVGKIVLVKYNKDGKYYAMKSMRKDQLISEGLADNILVERNILMEGQCEFILTLSFFLQTPERIYFICPYIAGGDLFHKLKEDIFFKEELVRFYAAQIAVALQHLHDLGIAYRDLKPENILIDEDGYIKLCDFGASVKIRGTEKENNFAGSPEYASPEMITYEGHTFMTDWWSFGVLIYELLYGNTPFYNIDKNRMFDLITNGSISYPKYIEIEGEQKPRNYKVSEDAKNLISKLLEKDPGNRLGRKGLDEIKKHPFFSGINFEDLKKKKLKAHFKPTINKEDPTNNFDEEYLTMELSESPISDWSKGTQFANWFSQFDNIWDEQPQEDNDDFEVIDSAEVEQKTQEGGDDED